MKAKGLFILILILESGCNNERYKDIYFQAEIIKWKVTASYTEDISFVQDTILYNENMEVIKELYAIDYIDNFASKSMLKRNKTTFISDKTSKIEYEEEELVLTKYSLYVDDRNVGEVIYSNEYGVLVYHFFRGKRYERVENLLIDRSNMELQTKKFQGLNQLINDSDIFDGQDYYRKGFPSSTDTNE